MIVDHPAPPPDFRQWLRGEIDRAENLDKTLGDRIMSLNTSQPKLAQVAAAHARLRALREVQWAYARSQEAQ